MDNAMGKDIKEKKEVVWCGGKVGCDLCGKSKIKEFVDGRTIDGPWAMMCIECHEEQGTGLGVGKGQLYKFRESDRKFVKTH